MWVCSHCYFSFVTIIFSFLVLSLIVLLFVPCCPSSVSSSFKFSHVPVVVSETIFHFFGFSQEPVWQYLYNSHSSDEDQPLSGFFFYVFSSLAYLYLPWIFPVGHEMKSAETKNLSKDVQSNQCGDEHDLNAL